MKQDSRGRAWLDSNLYVQSLDAVYTEMNYFPNEELDIIRTAFIYCIDYAKPLSSRRVLGCPRLFPYNSNRCRADNRSALFHVFFVSRFPKIVFFDFDIRYNVRCFVSFSGKCLARTVKR